MRNRANKTSFGAIAHRMEQAVPRRLSAEWQLLTVTKRVVPGTISALCVLIRSGSLKAQATERVGLVHGLSDSGRRHLQTDETFGSFSRSSESFPVSSVVLSAWSALELLKPGKRPGTLPGGRLYSVFLLLPRRRLGGHPISRRTRFEKADVELYPASLEIIFVGTQRSAPRAFRICVF